jgi:hypothetical protein
MHDTVIKITHSDSIYLCSKEEQQQSGVSVMCVPLGEPIAAIPLPRYRYGSPAATFALVTTVLMAVLLLWWGLPCSIIGYMFGIKVSNESSIKNLRFSET